MEQTACRLCGRDISRETYKYRDESGAILCEACFHEKPEMRPSPRDGFTFLKAASIMLKAFAVVALLGGIGLAHLRYPYGRLAAVEAVVSGVVIFILCFALGELIRLGISLNEKTSSLSRRIDSLTGALHRLEGERQQKQEGGYPGYRQW